MTPNRIGMVISSRRIEQDRTAHPKTVGRGELASRALALMEEWKITSLVVLDETGVVAGVLHLHDLWRLELF